VHALLLGLTLLAAPPTRTVLVLDLNVREGVSKDLAGTLSELMAIEVRKVATSQRIYSGADIKALLGFKKQKELLGCEDQTCLAELGGALGAQELVSGSLSIIADDYVLVLRRMDVVKSQVIEETTDNVAKASPAKLQAVVRAAIDRLWNPVRSTVPDLTVSEAPSAHRSRVAPVLLGAVAVVGVVASVIGWVQVANFESLRTQSQKLPSTVTYAQAQSAQSAATVGEVVGIAGIVVAVGGGTGAVITW